MSSESALARSKSTKSSIVKSSTFNARVHRFNLLQIHAGAQLDAQTASTLPVNGKAKSDETVNEPISKSLLKKPSDFNGGMKVLMTFMLPIHSVFSGFHLYSAGIFPLPF